MATESAVRLIGGTGARDWSKGFGAFDSSVGGLSGEDLGFVDNGTGVYGGWRESVTNRSGSAPPSMEGSLAALGHLIGQQSGSFEASLANLDNVTGSSKSEEQLCADPAYFEYYGSKVNLNPRLPPPLISRESCRLMNRVGKAKEWRVVSQDNSSKSSIYVPRSTLSTHKEEPEDDKSPRLDSSSVEDAQVISSASNFKGQDFMLGRFQQSVASLPDSSSSNPSNSNTGDAMTVRSEINLSRSLSVDAVKELDLNSWVPKSPLKTISNDISSSPLSSSSYTGNTGVQISQQEKPAVDTKLGNVVLGSGTAVTELDNVDSNMKNLKLSLDGHSSSSVNQKWQDNVLQQYGPLLPAQGDPIQMTPQGPHLSHVPFADNLSHTQLKLPAGDMQQFLPQLGMTSPFFTPNSFGSPYYQNLQPANAFPTSIGTGGYPVPGSVLPPSIASYAPQGSLATPLDSPMAPSFSGRPSGFPSTGNPIGGTDFMQSYKMYGQLGVGMQPSIPDPNFIHFFQHPSLLQYTGGNQYNTMVPRFTVAGNPAESFDPQKMMHQTAYPSDQRLQLPRTGFPNSPTSRRGGAVANYQAMSPYIGVPMSYPTSPVFQGQTLPGALRPGRRNDSVGFQSPTRNITANSGTQGQRERQKFDEPKACSFLEELKSNRARRVELSDITGRIVEYSADQHGSRFIQQKLENCTAEEKASVFADPHAASLMTDVFGNYVIQKDDTNQLMCKVWDWSMYGAKLKKFDGLVIQTGNKDGERGEDDVTAVLEDGAKLKKFDGMVIQTGNKDGERGENDVTAVLEDCGDGPEDGGSGPENGNSGPDNHDSGPENGNSGPDNHDSGPDNGNSGPDNYDSGLDASRRPALFGQRAVQVLAIFANFLVFEIFGYDGCGGRCIYVQREGEVQEEGMVDLVPIGPRSIIMADGDFTLEVYTDESGPPIREDWIVFEDDEIEEYTQTLWAGPGRRLEITYLVIPSAIEAKVEVKLKLKDHGSTNCAVYGKIKASATDYRNKSVHLFSCERRTSLFFPSGATSILPLSPSVVAVPSRWELQLCIKVDLSVATTCQEEQDKNLKFSLEFTHEIRSQERRLCRIGYPFSKKKERQVDDDQVEVNVTWYPIGT